MKLRSDCTASFCSGVNSWDRAPDDDLYWLPSLDDAISASESDFEGGDFSVGELEAFKGAV
jgi:hypothetical protein